MLVGIVNTQRQTEDEVFFQNFTGQNLFFFFFDRASYRTVGDARLGFCGKTISMIGDARRAHTGAFVASAGKADQEGQGTLTLVPGVRQALCCVGMRRRQASGWSSQRPGCWWSEICPLDTVALGHQTFCGKMLVGRCL